MKKLSKMEGRLLNVLGTEYVGSAVLMDRLYMGMKRPKTSTISPLIRRLREKGIQIETIRGKGYRLVSVRNLALTTNNMVSGASHKLADGLAYGGNIKTEIKGMLARYGINFAVIADLAMKAVRAIATPTPAYLLTAPPKYGATDYVKGLDGVYRAE